MDVHNDKSWVDLLRDYGTFVTFCDLSQMNCPWSERSSHQHRQDDVHFQKLFKNTLFLFHRCRDSAELTNVVNNEKDIYRNPFSLISSS